MIPPAEKSALGLGFSVWKVQAASIAASWGVFCPCTDGLGIRQAHERSEVALVLVGGRALNVKRNDGQARAQVFSAPSAALHAP